MLPFALQNAAIPQPVKNVLARLQTAGFQAYLVGGCVRDLFRGLAPKDFDLATSALPEQVTGLFKKVIPTGIAHGTVTVISSGMHVEVTTFRSEGSYVDGRRPTSVEYHSDVNEDLARRDFTINAMAFDPSGGTLVDPFGGQQDLAARLIRAVGDAKARFSEDGLRPLRAARFAAVLNFQLESSTEAAISETLDVFRKVSMERIREEFVKLLLAVNAEAGLNVLFQTGLLSAFLPEVSRDFALAKDAALRAPLISEVRLAALLHRIDAEDDASRGQRALQILERLKFPVKTQKDVATLLRFVTSFQISNNEVQARRAVASFGREYLEPMASLCDALQTAPSAERRALYTRALAGNPPLNSKELALNGAEIMRLMKTGPGPHIGLASRFLLDQVLEKPELNTPEKLSEILSDFEPSAAG